MTIRTHQLTNGLRIVTEDMPGFQSCSVGVWVAAGARHETPAQNGIAHFLEHMAFKGTATRSALEIATTIEDLGGHINAWTSRETTAYFARALSGDMGTVLDVLGDIVLNPAFDPREIEIERGVILQEIGQAHDTPDDVIFDWLQDVAFPDQPMGRAILGTPERVSGFGRDDLTSFVTRHYGPGQMVLAAAGGIDHDAIVAQAEAMFGQVPARPALRPDPASFAGGEHRVEKDLEQAHFALALPAPAWGDPAFYDAQIYALAMGGGMSSRLFQEAREKRGLCYTIFAGYGAHEDTGLLTIYAGTGADQIDELSCLVIDELRRSADGLTEAEVARARTQMKAGLLMGLESCSSRAERLARQIEIWARVIAIEETVARIEAVTVDTLRDHAMALCQDARLALALYGPVGGAPQAAAMAARLAA